MILILDYCKEGIPISDYECDDFLNSCLVGNCNYYKISTENIIQSLRAKVATGEICVEDVEIRFEGLPLQMNKYACIQEWPGVSVNIH